VLPGIFDKVARFRFWLVVLTSAFGFFSASSFADGHDFTLGPSALSFHYKEFPDDERLRNREDGLLPGVSAGLRFAPGSWRIRLAGSYHGGSVEYDGATSSGRPHRTDTDTDIFDFLATGGYSFAMGGSVTLAPYIGAGYRYWRRDILPNRGVSGLLEVYRWPYATVGLELGLYRTERFQGGIDVRFVRPINPKLDVDINPETTLDLGARTGYRVALPLRWSFGASQGILLEPYYEHQEIGESPPRNGILEPSSDTDIFAVNLTWQMRF
jgi:Autotransporter beta-domain